jgi:hypothetical protein
MSYTKSTIDCTVGIYDTEYTFVDHGDYITVTEPIIKWTSNSGTLDFERHKITSDRKKSAIRNMIENDCLIDDDGTPICDILE